MAKWYATCAEADYDETTGVCSAVVYVQDASGWLPELSNETGGELGAACFGALAIAFLFRLLFKKSG
jgi:hypothetical protein